MRDKRLKIGLVGCGAIGEGVALFIDRQLREKAVLWAIADSDTEKAEVLTEKLCAVPKMLNVDELIKGADFIIEAASVNAARYILRKAVTLKKNVLILSVGALIEDMSILEKAKKRGINIYVPSGAICGVDGLGALSLGGIKRITLTTSKPPKGLSGIDYLKKKGISVAHLTKEKVIFRGNVKEAIRYFPQNINVAAIILLASSFQKVEVCIKADPGVQRNIHRIEIDTEEAKVSIAIENVPSKANPKTSTLAILSTQYLLKKIFSSFKIGS
ncbi:MAG: aspartate dehydrogenase domain-containing protein [Candidatus Omnitrophota bacterium]